MGSLLELFKAAPHIEEISDKKEVDKKYKYWRMRTFYSMLIGYTLFYFTRNSFNVAKLGMIGDMGWDLSSVGLLSSLLYISYGLSKFFSGILSDRSNPRYFMAAGLMMTGVCNLFFGLSTSFLMFGVFMVLNGWFQAGGWSPCARLLTHWYSQSERGSWWSTWNVSHNIGALLIPWIMGIAMTYYGWRYAMYLPGVICIAGGFFLVNRLRDTPQSLGLPSIEKYRNDYTGSGLKEGEEEKELSTREILFDYVLSNKYLWLLGLAYFFVYVVRIGVFEWSHVFLTQTRGYGILGAVGCSSIFQVGGACGSLAAGWLSDKVFGAKRGPVNVLFALGMLASVFFFWSMPAGYPILDYIGIFLIGFVVFGPQMLIGVAAAELSHKKASATATGFIGFIAYIGAACAGQPVGKITDVFGWEGYFIVMAICSVCSFLLLLPLWGVRENPNLSRSKELASKSLKETAAGS